MKKLILIRHAKSSWKFDVIDHERPLNDKGLTDSRLVANFLSHKNLEVDHVIVSDALRTKLTSGIILPKLNIKDDNISFSHELYDFSGVNLTQAIKDCDNSIDKLMVFGHNHAITSFVNTYGSIVIDNVPTCGVVMIEFNIDNWQQLNRGKTIETIFPRDLRD